MTKSDDETRAMIRVAGGVAARISEAMVDVDDPRVRLAALALLAGGAVAFSFEADEYDSVKRWFDVIMRQSFDRGQKVPSPGRRPRS